MSKAASKHAEKVDKVEAKTEVPDAKDEAGGGVEDQMQDSKRYRWLRDMTRNGDGSINERLYVRCDGRYGGEWALTGEQLDNVLDALIINVLDAAADEVVAEATEDKV